MSGAAFSRGKRQSALTTGVSAKPSSDGSSNTASACASERMAVWTSSSPSARVPTLTRRAPPKSGRTVHVRRGARFQDDHAVRARGNSVEAVKGDVGVGVHALDGPGQFHGGGLRPIPGLQHVAGGEADAVAVVVVDVVERDAERGEAGFHSGRGADEEQIVPQAVEALGDGDGEFQQRGFFLRHAIKEQAQVAAARIGPLGGGGTVSGIAGNVQLACVHAQRHPPYTYIY